MTTYTHIAAYKFVGLTETDLDAFTARFKQQTSALGIKGTILLSLEGINLFLSGTTASVQAFVDLLLGIDAFSDICIKWSTSDHMAFKRMTIRVKAEIISMYQPHIHPEKKTAPYLDPNTLDQWYAQNKEMIVLDTRNDYEIEVGAFKKAIHLNLKQFSDFPAAIADQLPASLKRKTIVTYCTGGIRCEKAAAYLLDQGFEDVWQLDGGILNYFEKTQENNFEGNCFVFDARFALDSNLKPIE